MKKKKKMKQDEEEEEDEARWRRRRRRRWSKMKKKKKKKKEEERRRTRMKRKKKEDKEGKEESNTGRNDTQKCGVTVWSTDLKLSLFQPGAVDTRFWSGCPVDLLPLKCLLLHLLRLLLKGKYLLCTTALHQNQWGMLSVLVFLDKFATITLNIVVTDLVLKRDTTHQGLTYVLLSRV